MGPPIVDPETGTVSLFDPEFARCPQPVYAELRSRCRVARAALTESPVVSRYEDVVWALRHPEIFSSAVDTRLVLGTERPMIPQQVDPPAQTRYRKLLDPHFSRKRMAELVPDIRRHANALIDAFVDAGRCEFDEQFAIPLPCTAFLALLGLPADQLEFFLEIKDGIIRPQKGRDAMTLEQMKEVRVESGRKSYACFEEALDERGAAPRDDLLTTLLRAEIDGERLSRSEILDICFLLLLAGLDTVTATLGCNIAYLASNPSKRRSLVEDPSLVPTAVEELLRWETPVTGLPRIAVQDVTIGDFEIRKGELVTLLLGAANTDDEHFPEAQRVDFLRERNVHTAFGVGVHRCLGSHLARMELQVALEEWHRRIPDYRIEPGETPRVSPGIREFMYLPLVWDV
jgi:cytochrome P450